MAFTELFFTSTSSLVLEVTRICSICSRPFTQYDCCIRLLVLMHSINWPEYYGRNATLVNESKGGIVPLWPHYIHIWQSIHGDGPLSLVHTSSFSVASFSVTIIICWCAWKNMLEFCDKYICWKTDVPFFMWQRKNVICKSLFVYPTRHRKFAT